MNLYRKWMVICVNVILVVYELFRRNSFYPYFWAKERITGDIIFVIDIHEKETGISKWLISDGIFIAKFNHNGTEIPIFRRGERREEIQTLC